MMISIIRIVDMIERRFKWTSSQKTALENLISGMSKEHPEQHAQIIAASDFLFAKYRKSDSLTDDEIRLLDSASNNWYIDPENGGVVTDHMYSDDWGLSSRTWNKEGAKEKKQRENDAKIARDIKFSFISSISIRSCKVSKFWSNFPKKCRRFDGSHNNLKSLKGGPVKVLDNYDCSYNELKSLEGAPIKVESMSCNKNSITSLSGLRVKKMESLKCSHNQLTDLVGCPEITDWLDVSFNQLISVKGAPINLNLRQLNFKGNLVSEKTLKMVFNSMKKERGDYETGLSKVWKKIPVDDRLHMFQDNPELSDGEIKRYSNLRRYNNLKDLI
jgi:hypothetical protein